MNKKKYTISPTLSRKALVYAFCRMIRTKRSSNSRFPSLSRVGDVSKSLSTRVTIPDGPSKGMACASNL